MIATPGLPETQATIRVIQLFKGRLAGDLVVRDRGGVLPDGRWPVDPSSSSHDSPF